jgi:hypothetical protein
MAKEEGCGRGCEVSFGVAFSFDQAKPSVSGRERGLLAKMSVESFL